MKFHTRGSEVQVSAPLPAQKTADLIEQENQICEAKNTDCF
jgi:hypothetical protein